MTMISMIKSIWRGKTLLRTLLNKKCQDVSLLNKKVLDLGSGQKAGTYHDFFKDKAQEVFTADMKSGYENHRALDFEKDPLPYDAETFDAVLSFNLFEHIFNHAQLISEVFRVLKNDGELIGFVPFLINYHPDPQDYFRYTEDALRDIFKRAGFSDSKIEIIGGGPFMVNYNNLVLSLPKILRVILLPLYLFLDKVFLKLRPQAKRRYPLGYFFIVKKHA